MIAGSSGAAPVWDLKPYEFLEGAEAARRPSIPACGGRRSSISPTACSRSPSASTRCAASTSPTSPSSKATAA
ncbi:MAG: hypothetical protein MZV49_00445 [Rhodopseudomonas palustris]|nr:hypothetical protein [Rhodopseudomonas palustris]